MLKTAVRVSAIGDRTVDLTPYIATARRRRQQEREQLQQRRQQALLTAQAAAQLLRDQFGVSRVVVFGSVLDERTFHAESDIDVAVWDLPSEHYLSAVATLLALSDFSVDLVPAEAASPYLQTAIAQGLPL